MKVGHVAFLALCCLSVVAWFVGVTYQVKGSRRTTSGRHWWFHAAIWDPLFQPAAWPPEARTYWKKSLFWAGIFLAAVGAGFLVPLD